MKQIMLVGKTGAGKTSLIQALNNQELRYSKTQSLEYSSGMLDTPGEYLENKRYYKALMVSSVDYDTIALLQPADEEHNYYPAGFSNIFMNKEVIGIVTKTDKPDANIPRAEEMLRDAGCSRIFYLSPLTGEGLEELRQYLMETEGE